MSSASSSLARLGRQIGPNALPIAIIVIVIFFAVLQPAFLKPENLIGIVRQMALIGIIVANLATKRAAATAAGFTGFFGYASTVLSGWGLGKLADKFGWNVVFDVLLWTGVIGTLLFAMAWKAKAHGYAGAED